MYVHCVQGVSRSATVCLAYLIYKQKITFNQGLTYIKERRPVANPNMTFIAQLICFYKRLFEESFDSVPISPRVFMIGSHQPEDPELIVPILVSVYYSYLVYRLWKIFTQEKAQKFLILEECLLSKEKNFL